MRFAQCPVGLLLLCGGLCSISGCSGNRSMPKEFGQLYPVEGKVTFDGKPLRGGNVTFFALDHDMTQLQPMGLIDGEGNYFVSSYQQKGAPAGKYRVIVLPAEGSDRNHPPIDRRYGRYETSGIEITVEPKENKISIPVKRPPRVGR